ncbi:MAG: DUF502 domain-containing protein [Candidatus Omnitrophica bacterium]|nr:DUF502 domain-containing protein [Candidatus Omnitrophota bacterium]
MKNMMNKFRNYFLSGLIVFLPLALTIYIFVLAIGFADSLIGKYLEPSFAERFGFYFPGISILVGIYIIVVIGFIVTNFVGKKVYDFFENMLIRLPFFRQVYPALKEMAVFLFARDRYRTFKQVVLVQYPRKGIYSIGFLTNERSAKKISDAVKQDLCNVFVPSAPGPLTGFAIMVPVKDLIYVDLSVEDAFKFIVSGGVVNPPMH